MRDATLRGIVAPKNGYIFVYVSNESNLDVFFDNLQVIHKPSPILEETHYYPFGLTMAGISSKAAGSLANRLKYNGIEQNNDFDLNMYDARYRNLDPELGRFWQPDPESEVLDSYSPYESMGNNPVNNVDPLGDFKTKFGAWLHKVFNGGGTIGENSNGEYYVSKTSSSSSEDGSVTVTASVSYGKGRHADSPQRDKLVERFEALKNVEEATKLGIWDPNLDANQAGWRAVGLGLGVTNPTLMKGSGAANTGSSVAKIESNSLVKTGVEISKHAAQRMGERGITQKMVETAIAKGAKFFDPKNGTFNYILKNGFASGKDLLVGTNTLTGKVTTVIRGNNLTKTTFIPQ